MLEPLHPSLTFSGSLNPAASFEEQAEELLNKAEDLMLEIASSDDKWFGPQWKVAGWRLDLQLFRQRRLIAEAESGVEG
jgi:hypothetical protein